MDHVRIARRMDQLEGRWQDEKEYEDFADYVKNIKLLVEASGGVFEKLTERPFAVTYTAEYKHHEVRVMKTGIKVTSTARMP